MRNIAVIAIQVTHLERITETVGHWRMRDAGVGEDSQNRLSMTPAFSLPWRRVVDAGASMGARTGHSDAGVFIARTGKGGHPALAFSLR